MKDILEKDLGKKWSLTKEERSSLWESVSRELPSAAPDRGGFLWWAVPAAVAAAVAAFFLLRSPSSSPTPFQPEIKPIEKTTTLADGNGAVESAESPTREKEAQMPVLAYSGTHKVSGQQGISEREADQATVETPESKDIIAEEKPEETVTETPKKEEKEQQAASQEKARQGTAPIKPSATEKQVKEYYKAPSTGKRFAFSASSNFSGRGKIEGPSSNMIKAVASQFGYVAYSNAPSIQQISETKYALPLNFALGVSYRVNDVLTVGTGVSYSYLHSKYNGLINGQYFDIKQGVHYVGVPVNLYFNLGSAGNFDFYAAAGGAAEKGVKVTYRMKSASGSGKTSDSHVKGVQFSTKAVGGMEYRFGKGKNVGIYLEPGITYYFDSDVPASIRTDQPLQFEAQAGIRFHLK
ncbi:MAG: outer membrane beta-barrel protein [Bacteroidales bacterium]|nr:outer membrane beta-barrel protein [Bacteroidales bacterium]